MMGQFADLSIDNFSERNDTNQSRSSSINDLGGDEDETSATGDVKKRGKRKVHVVTRRYSLRSKNLKKSSKEGSKE